MKGESGGDFEKQGKVGGVERERERATEDGLGCGGVTRCQESGRMRR